MIVSEAVGFMENVLLTADNGTLVSSTSQTLVIVVDHRSTRNAVHKFYSLICIGKFHLGMLRYHLEGVGALYRCVKIQRQAFAYRYN